MSKEVSYGSRMGNAEHDAWEGKKSVSIGDIGEQIKGERLRLGNAIDRMRANLSILEQALSHDWVGPIGEVDAQAVLGEAGTIARQIIKIDLLDSIARELLAGSYRKP